jgi:hypothetical protein
MKIQRKGSEEEIKIENNNSPNKSAADRKAYRSNEKSHTNAASVTCVLLV